MKMRLRVRAAGGAGWAAWTVPAPRVALALLLGCALFPAAAHADTLVLKEEAFVKGPKVFLGELAEIEGVNAEILAAIEVTSAALPGGSKNLNAALVESRIRTAGLGASDVEIRGARRIHTTTMHNEIGREMVAESLRTFILEKMPWDPERTEIDVPPVLSDFVVPEGVLDIEWRPSPQYRYVGSGAFRGTILVDGQPKKTLSCRAVVEPYVEVVMAANDIPRGRPISMNDLELREMGLSMAPTGAMTNPSQAVGLLARRTIFPGQPLTTRNVEPPTVIKRNQLVAVQLRAGALHMQSRAKALSDARAGDTLICENLNSKDRFQGVVRADGVVVVQ